MRSVLYRLSYVTLAPDEGIEPPLAVLETAGGPADRAIGLDHREGFEPSLQDSKSCVLPLDDR